LAVLKYRVMSAMAGEDRVERRLAAIFRVAAEFDRWTIDRIQ
jgi:hypothetical protein